MWQSRPPSGQRPGSIRQRRSHRWRNCWPPNSRTARKVVFLIDEAHLLRPQQLEELRLLSNAEMDSASPFAGLLIGQPTLATRPAPGNLRRPRSAHQRPLRDRGMDLAESVGYLRHHLELAGRTDQLIADGRCREAAPLCERDPPCAPTTPPWLASWQPPLTEGTCRRPLREEGSRRANPDLNYPQFYRKHSGRRRSVTAVISRRRFASACRHAETSSANDADPFSSNPAGKQRGRQYPGRYSTIDQAAA